MTKTLGEVRYPYQKKWYEDKKKSDKDFLRGRAEGARKHRINNPEKRMLVGARQRAKDKGISCTIELCDIIIPEVCPVFKTPFIVGTQYAASLDRINPTKGYEKGNVQVISRKANAMKQDASQEELERFCEWVKTLVVS